MTSFDVIVIGGGPAGAACAMSIAHAGAKVALLEKEAFPRFHIGESLTGTAGDFIARHGLTDAIEEIGAVSKPGVRVVGQDAARDFYVPVLRPTWQVERASFDAVLLDRARRAGAELVRGVARAPIQEAGRVRGVTVETADGRTSDLRARIVIDCSGQHAFMSRHGIAGRRVGEAFDRQIAIHAHFEGVTRPEHEPLGATVILYGERLHWAWMIPMSSSRTSIGVVMPTASYKQHGADMESVQRWSFDHVHPELRERTASSRRVGEVRADRNYSYRIDPFVGRGWLCVGDAHRFVDPIFSFGVSFALTEAEAAIEAVTRALGCPSEEADAFAAYAAYCERGQRRAADLIHYFWRFPGFFAYLTRGSRANDVVRLLAGDCFTEQPLEASTLMAEALTAMPVSKPLEEAS